MPPEEKNATPPLVQPNVPVLHTYRDDVVEAVKRGASVTSIAAAEANRRARAPQTAPVTDAPEGAKNKLLLWGSGALILLALLAGAGTWLFSKATTETTPPTTLVFPDLITVEQKAQLPIAGATGDRFMSLLTKAVSQSSLTLGAIEAYYPVDVAGDATHLLTAQEFLNAIGRGIPDSLVRSLAPTFLFGVHSFDGNQPFFIFTTNSYENAFSGMLAWEETMQRDLAPTFGPILTTADQLPVASSTTADILGPTSFADKVLRNKDTRVLADRTGKVVLLYSFIDRQTLVVTTNEYTLAEVVSRLQAARLP